MANLGGAGRQAASGDINLSSGLVGYWKLDGNAKDSTPYQNNGTVTSATLTTDRKGRANSAYSFAGTSGQKIALAGTGPYANFGTNSFTLTSWVNTTDSGGQKCIFSTAGSSTGFRFGYSGGKPYYLVGDGPHYQEGVIGSTTLNDGQWHHLAITYVYTTNWTVTSYIDGVNTGSVSLPSTVGSVNDTYAFIGTMTGTTSGLVIGSLDDVRTYNRALSANEITALYNQYDSSLRSAAGENGLVGWWKLDGNVTDSTPYGHAASLVGSPSYVADRKGQANSALGISSSSQMIDNAGVDLGNDWTVSVWSPYPNNGLEQTGHWRTLIRGNVGDHQIIVQSGGYALGSYDNTGGTGFHACTPTFNVNTLSSGWHNFTVTQTGGNTGTMLFYVDGSQVCSISGYGSTTDIRSIGNYFGGGQQWGTIDDFRVYDRALSPTEVVNLYSSYNSQVNLGGGSNTVALGKGLVGDWALNGNAKDTTPYADNGIINNGATLTTDRKGRANSAYNFNGTNQYINVGTNPVLTPPNISISAWVKASSLGSWNGIISNMTSWGTGFGLEMGTAEHIAAMVSGSYMITSWMPSTGVWYHIVATHDATTNQNVLYVNGNQEATLTHAVSYEASPKTYIGVFYTSPSLYFNGTIDDVRIYNRALSAAEVAALYQEYR